MKNKIIWNIQFFKDFYWFWRLKRKDKSKVKKQKTSNNTESQEEDDKEENDEIIDLTEKQTEEIESKEVKNDVN